MTEEFKTIAGDDLEIAEKLKRGEVTGPVVTPNCILINLRITGTGETPRQYKGKEYIFNRPTGIFLTDKFLKMCNGLPVIFIHPADGELDYQNWKEHIVGMIFLPYIKGSEVWGVAKIFDLTILEKINSGFASTSPFVTSQNIERADGKIDEKLEDINHVAIVEAGHWDQVQKELPIANGDIIFKEESSMSKEELVKKDPNKVDSVKADAKKMTMREAQTRAREGQFEPTADLKTGNNVVRVRQPDRTFKNEVIVIEDIFYVEDKADAAPASALRLQELIKQFPKLNYVPKMKSEGFSQQEINEAEQYLKIDSAQKVDNESAKELELTKDKILTGGNNMADEMKKDEKIEEKKDAAVQVGAEKKDEAKKDKCDEEKKDEAPVVEKKDEKPAEEKKDAANPFEKKEDAEEGSKIAALEAEIATLKAAVEKLVGAEKGEGEKFKEIGTEHEVLTADDDEKEELVNAVSELADAAHADIKIVRPSPKRYESKFDYVRRFLNYNKDLVNSKHQFLLTKVDSANFAVAKEAISLIGTEVTAKTRDLNKKTKGAAVKVQTEDGAITDINYGRN